MSFRVTSNTLSRNTLDGLQADLARFQRTQEQLSSGRRINRPSDSPVDTATAMRLRSEQQQITQRARNIDDGLGWLGSADTAIGQAASVLQRVRQLSVSGLNSTNGPTEREAMAAEIDELRSGLIGIANTQHLGRPIFAGTQDGPAAFDEQTGTYLGNGSAVQRNVSSDGTGELAVTVPGNDVFSTLLGDGSGADGILAHISAGLRAGDLTAVDTGLADLDTASATMQAARSLVGARFNRLTGIQGQAETRLDSVTASLAATENIDLPRTIIDLQVQQTAYQAALGATAKIIQPSLLDFLR